MDMRHDELDEASYQLMMDIQTGRALEPPQPRRRRKLLGTTLIILGGFAGLLLASGHLTSEPTSVGKAVVSPLTPAVSPIQSQVSPDPVGFPSKPDVPLPRPPLADLQPTPPKPAPDTKKLTAAPTAPSKSKSVSKRPQRVDNHKRVAKRSWTEQPQTVLQRRSPQWWSRSPVHDFDPNAELVRSSP